jgi:hypothetical protein
MITYDLVAPGQNYKGLIEAIKANYTWWHFIESSWLIHTSDSASSIYAKIKQSFDGNDRVLIIQVTNDYQGWLPEDAWKWIKEKIG